MPRFRPHGGSFITQARDARRVGGHGVGYRLAFHCEAPTRLPRDGSEAEMTALLDRLKGLNFTTVCFQVRSMGDVMYDSALEPWSGFLTGEAR